MEKKLNKPHEGNVRLENPHGLLGVPPDLTPCVTIISPGSVVIVTGDVRVIRPGRRKSLPQ